MLVWIVFALMTVAAALAVVIPLARGSRSATPAAAFDKVVYRDQLDELERDRQRGLIGDAEAEAARTEIARRLLKADAEAGAGAERRSWARPAATAVVVAVPLIAVGLYAALGSPDMPDQPLAARLANPPDPGDVPQMLARVEAHLVNQPDDVQGWHVVAPVYMRMGRADDAAKAFRQILRLDGPSPEINEQLGEALVAANGGLVGEDAQAALDAAVAADPERPKARFYRALGLLQAGKAEAALADYDTILAQSPADAPWLAAVRENRRQALAALGRPATTPEPATRPALSAGMGEGQGGGSGQGPGPRIGAMPGPDANAVAAAEAMTPEARAAFVGTMVQRLADRLADQPQDAAGWMQLMRAYTVLERPEDAAAALKKAKDAFKDDPTTLAALDDAAKGLGLTP